MRAAIFALALALPFAVSAAENCPREGHHIAKDAEGRKVCVDNGTMTCPDKFTQMLVHGRFHCVSKGVVKQDKKCFEGTKIKLDNGQIRCTMGEYDKCEPGFHVIRLPGNHYACTRPMQ